MSVNVSFAGQTFSIPSQVGENGWGTNLTTFLQALASNAATSTIQKQSIRTALTTPVNLTTTDYAVVINLSVAGAVSAVIPAGVTGQIYSIIDGKGDGKTNNITISCTSGQLVNGAATYLIKENFGGVSVCFDGTGWKILTDFVGQDPTFATIKITSLSTGLLHSDASGNITSSLLINADVSNIAAIAYSKLALTGAILNADLAGSIAYSKLALTGAILNADLAGSIADSKLSTISTALKIANSATTATSANTASAIVARDVSNNFSAGTITASLTGNASGTAANVTGIVAQANGGLGVAYTSTGALTLPTGSVANRPSPVAGMARLNTDSNSFEGYANGIWQSIGGGVNNRPQTNYLKTYAEANVAPGTLSTVAVGGNITIASGTSAFYADVTSGSAALISSVDTSLRGSNNYLTVVTGASLTGSVFVQLPAMTLETADAGKPISITFDTTGNTLDGDYDVVVANYTSAGVFVGLIPVAGNASSSTSTASAKIPTGTSTFNGFFVSTSTAGDTFALRFRRLANSVQIRIDSLMVGNTPVRVGAPVTDWVSYTPTTQGFSATTVTNSAFFWRRNGSALEITGTFDSATVQASEARIYFPSGLVASSGKTGVKGAAHRAITTASTRKRLVAYLDNTAAAGGYVVFGSDDYTTAAYPNVALAGNVGFGSTESMFFAVSGIEISNWSSNITMADRAVEEFASSTTGTWDAAAAAGNTVYGPAGSVISGALTAGRNKVVRFQTPIQATDTVVLEYQLGSATGIWVPQHESAIAYQTQQATEFGCKIASASGTDVTVSYNQFSTAGSMYNTTTGAGNYSSAQTYAWRLRKVSSGAQIGGAISTANIVGRVDGSTPGTGYIGEQIRSAVSTNTAFPTSNTYGDLTSISLTPGVWDISVGVYASLGSATTFTSWVGGVGTGSGTSTAGVVVGDSVFVALPPTSASDAGNSVSQFRVVVPSGASVPYYLKYQAIYTGTAPNARGRISAVRVS